MRIDLGNLNWVTGNDARAVEEIAEGDVAAFVEARTKSNQPVRIGRILRDYKVAQNVRNGATAGTAIAVLKGSPVKLKRARSMLASRAGRKVQARHMQVAVLVERTRTHRYETHMVVVHNPLRSTGRQDDAIRSVARRAEVARDRRSRVRAYARGARRGVRVGLGLKDKPGRKRVVRWVVIGDFNTSHAVMCERIGGAHSFGRDVMGAVFSSGWGDLKFDSRRVPGSDHAVLEIRERR